MVNAGAAGQGVTRPCPACGAPVLVSPGASSVRCGHCRAVARVERTRTAGGVEVVGDLRLVARAGVRWLFYSVAVAAALAAMVMVGLLMSHAATPGPAREERAVYVVDLSRGSRHLEDFRAALLLEDGRVVVGSSTGRLEIVEPTGHPRHQLDLPLPEPKARLGGLARAPGGFHATIGGALVRVTGRKPGPLLPVEPQGRVLGAIATDGRGVVHAITAQGEAVRLDSEARPVWSARLGLPERVRPQEITSLTVCPDGSLVLAEPHSTRLWRFDVAQRTLTGMPRALSEHAGSNAECLPDGSLLIYAGRHLLRFRFGEVPSTGTLRVEHPDPLGFAAVATDAQGGLALLSPSGYLVRYAALPGGA